MRSQKDPSTLLLASLSLPSARTRLDRTKAWVAGMWSLDEGTDPIKMGNRTFYGGSDKALDFVRADSNFVLSSRRSIY